MKEHSHRVKDLITAAAELCGITDTAAKEIAFHMTDWDDDLERMVRLYKDCENMTPDEALEILLRFLAHVPNHLAAAKKLVGYGPIEDIFKVGVLEEDQS
jgi:hypothetical protein